MEKFITTKDAIKALSNATGINRQRIERFVSATANNTNITNVNTKSDLLVGNIVNINSRDYIYVKNVKTNPNGFVSVEGSLLRYINDKNGFVIMFNEYRKQYVSEDHFVNNVKVLTDEEFISRLEGSLIPAETLLAYLNGTKQTQEEIVEDDKSTLKTESIEKTADVEEATEVVDVVASENAPEVVEL